LARRLVNPLTAKAGKPVNDLSELLRDKNASKIFLNLLHPLNKGYLNSKDIAYLTTQKKIEEVKGSTKKRKKPEEEETQDGEEDEKKEDAPVVMSKKPLPVRRAQILKHVLLPVLNSITQHLDELLRCPIASNVVLETLLELSRQLYPFTEKQLQEQKAKEKQQQNEKQVVGVRKKEVNMLERCL